MNTLAGRVARDIRQHATLQPGERVLVAVSGGPDSLALLAILRELTGDFGFRLTVGHFDHRWRADSGEDARFVTGIARTWGFGCVVGGADEHGSHTEDAARRARYQFLRTLARSEACSVIALGHTQDDQVETLLLHLLRGSGARGLRGMRPRSDDLARPLLQTTRWEVEAYLESRRLTPRQDPTNNDPRYRRNRLRQSVVPALDRFDPTARRLLARTAEILAEEDDLLEDQVQRLPAAILSDASAMQSLPVALQRRLMVRANPSWTFAQVEAARLRARPVPAPHGAPVRFMATPCTCDPADFQARAQVGHVDADTLVLPLLIEHRHPGDRVRPLGFPHPKRLQDILVDAHIPRHLRDALPILRDQRGIVWIPGVTVANEHRVTSQTERQLHLEILPLHGEQAAVTTS